MTNYMFSEPTTHQTRRESHNAVKIRLTRRHQQILDILGERTMTADEILDEMVNRKYIPYYNPNSVRPRLNELRDEFGLVKDVGKTMGRCGVNVALWRKTSEQMKLTV